MPTETHKPSVVDGGADLHTALKIWGTVADTTWRMFVPVIGLTLVGYALDGLLKSRPVFIFSGLALGIVIAVALVFVQYKNVTNRKDAR